MRTQTESTRPLNNRATEGPAAIQDAATEPVGGAARPTGNAGLRHGPNSGGQLPPTGGLANGAWKILTSVIQRTPCWQHLFQLFDSRTPSFMKSYNVINPKVKRKQASDRV
ncbi:unnamed protein product [Sphagnum tenellum]